MITVKNVALDSLPADLRAFFMGAVQTKQTDQTNQTKQTDQTNQTKQTDQTAQAKRHASCSDVIASCEDIPVHELELITIDPESFALYAGEW